MQNSNFTKGFSGLIMMLGFSFSLIAQTGFNASYAILSLNGGSNTFYDLNAATGNPDFQGNNLGFFTSSSSIVVKSAQNNVYKCNSCDIWQTKVHYRIYQIGTTPPAFSELVVGYSSGLNNGCAGADQRWENANGMTNLLAGQSFGCYKFEIYTSLQYQTYPSQSPCLGGSGSGTINNNNSGNYFTATFTYWEGTGELCNGLDDDCDSSIDEGLTFTTYFTDGDNDGFGIGAGTSYCANPGVGFALTNTDCNDSNASIKPGATEICNGIDDNCVGGIDEGVSISVPTIPGTYTSSPVNHLDGATNTYLAACNLLAQIVDAGGGNTLGNTTVSSLLSASVVNTNPDGFIYGRRKYTVNATSNGAATMTLYFTQTDFDNYNSNNPNFLDLPTSGNNSDPNKLYFRIARVSGGAYSISASLGNSLTWNSTDNRWEVSFPVTNVNADYYFVTMLSCDGISVNNLAVTNNAGTSVLATWNSVVTTPPSGWYSLQYRTTQPTPGTWNAAGTSGNASTSKLISGLTPGTEYEIQIRRHCSNESAGPWSGVTFTTSSPECAFPPVLTVGTVTGNTAVLTWTSVAGAAWYEFRYSTSPTGPWTSGGTLGVPATSRLFTGLAISTTYYVQARSFCSLNGLPSAWSSNSTFTTTALAGCELPPSLTADIVNGTNVTVSWSAISGAGWYEFRYRLLPAGSFISAGTLGGAATSKIFTGLVPGTMYELQARTFCNNGLPSAWGGINVTTNALTGCELPPVLSVGTVFPTRVILTWPAVAGAGWFEFRYSTSPTGPWTSAGTVSGVATSKLIIGLMTNTNYFAQARTFCNNGIPSDWSLSANFTTGLGLAYQIGDETISTMEDNVMPAENENPVPEVQQEDNAAINGNSTESNLVSTFTLFPNPTKDNLHIAFNLAQERQLSIAVLDMTGRVLRQMEVAGWPGMNLQEINLENLPGGMYMIQLRDHGRLTFVGKAQKLN